MALQEHWRILKRDDVTKRAIVIAYGDSTVSLYATLRDQDICPRWGIGMGITKRNQGFVAADVSYEDLLLIHSKLGNPSR